MAIHYPKDPGFKKSYILNNIANNARPITHENDGMDDKNISQINYKEDEDANSGSSDTTGDATGTGSSGGTGGQIEFHDFIGIGSEQTRDDTLSVDEKRRLIAVHKDNHEWKVKKQKDLLTRRKEVKEGKIPLSEYREGRGYGAGMNGLTKTHPLSNTAQFGNGSVDDNVNSVPNEYDANTNDENRLELEYQYKLENKLVQTYAQNYTPKPSPFK